MTGESTVQQCAARVRLVVLDVDGVLTDGSLHYGPDGEAIKRFHVRDGMGVRMLRHFGVQVAVISARASKLVERRMRDLGIAHWHVGQDDKCVALDSILAQLGLQHDQVAYLGDDVLDVPVMRKVGLPCAVSDAHPFTRAEAHWVAAACGGNGAVRELADLILGACEPLADVYERFLQSEAPQGAGRASGAAP